MSRENVEVVRRGWEAWIGGDVDALFEIFHPAVEWDTTNYEGWPEDEVYRRHDGLRRFFEEWRASWDRYETGVEEYIDAGGDRVLVLCWQRGFGSDSQVPVQMDYAQLCTVQDGLVRRMDVYSDRSEALEAVGLREQAMSQENVEIVVGLIDAWNRGDRGGWLTGSHPEIEWSSAILRQVEGRDTIARGRAELEAFWDEWHALWNLTIEASEMRDLGDSVLVLADMRTQGKASGAAVERSIGYVFEFEDGLLRRANAYLSPAEALEAAGLRE